MKLYTVGAFFHPIQFQKHPTCNSCCFCLLVVRFFTNLSYPVCFLAAMCPERRPEDMKRLLSIFFACDTHRCIAQQLSPSGKVTRLQIMMLVHQCGSTVQPFKMYSHVFPIPSSLTHTSSHIRTFKAAPKSTAKPSKNKTPGSGSAPKPVPKSSASKKNPKKTRKSIQKTED